MQQGAAGGWLQRCSLSCSYAFGGATQMAVSQPGTKTKLGVHKNSLDEHDFIRQSLLRL
jgi:hypothetical protein